MPSAEFLRRSVRLWKARHTYRTARLNLWRRRESYRYSKWLYHRKRLPKTHPLRAKWWRLYAEAHVQVDKWHGLRDEAALWLRRRRRQLAATRPSDQLTANFRVSEFNCRDGTPVPKAAIPALRRLCRDVLEPLRAQYGHCTVTSGHRTRSYNARIGGASRSEHIYDQSPSSVAADVKFARGRPAQWAATARRRSGVGGVGQYDRAGFVHCDHGPRRNWWG